MSVANVTSLLPVDTSSATSSFLILSAAAVFIMTPGLGFFYSGMARSKNSLSLVMLCFLAMAIVTVQWFIWGFSLSYSQFGTPFIGSWDYMGFSGVNGYSVALTAPAASSIVYALYQLMFAAVTPAIIFGSVAERVRMLPSMVFIFCWSTIVYDVVAYWTWAARGWIRNLSCLDLAGNLAAIPCQIGGYDFAGGGPVHIASGFSGLAFCIFLGRRRNVDKHTPSSLNTMFLGTALLWFGWILFNAGAESAANARAGFAGFNTMLSASSGGLTWVLWDFIFLRKLSGLSFCSGVVAGLVSVTPASGFVAPWAAFVIGIIGGFVTNIACRLKPLFAYDDTLDAFGIHGVGGIMGNFLTGIFAQSWVIGLDGTTTALGGAIDGRPILIGYNLAGSCAIAGWSFALTFILLWLISRIPGFHFRSSAEQELYGDDLGEMGEINMEAAQTKRAKTSESSAEGDGSSALPAAPRLRVHTAQDVQDSFHNSSIELGPEERRIVL